MSISSNQHHPLPFSIINASAPENLLFQLEQNRHASFLTLRRQQPKGRVSYLIEMAHGAQQGFTKHNIPPDRKWCKAYLGSVDWPGDLTTVPGLWQYPLRFSFLNLTVLDLGIKDAVLWLMPILDATDPAAPLRRIFIRSCDDWNEQVFPFPFDALDEALSFRLEAKLLIGWAYDDEAADTFIKIFQIKLPMLDSRGGIGVLYCVGPKGKFDISPHCRSKFIYSSPSFPSA
jgi:hypothetical protein